MVGLLDESEHHLKNYYRLKTLAVLPTGPSFHQAIDSNTHPMPLDLRVPLVGAQIHSCYNM